VRSKRRETLPVAENGVDRYHAAGGGAPTSKLLVHLPVADAKLAENDLQANVQVYLPAELWRVP
jgi:hypothetical protein